MMASTKSSRVPARKTKAKAKTKTKTQTRAPAKKKAAKPARRNVKAWTDQDIQQLKQLAGKKSAGQIGKALKRSLAAVTFKAFTLRVSLRVGDSKRGRVAAKRAKAR
jgi:hypothetical protein